MAPLLSLAHVSKSFSGGALGRGERTLAVNDVSLSLSNELAGITGIAGESGSGKTTLAMLMMGQLLPDSGEVTYRGQAVRRMCSADLRQMRREVQPIFQDPFAAFNPFYKVDHVLAAPMRNYRLAPSPAIKAKHITEALERVGLNPAETLGRFPHQLSGGQRQRVMIARALLCQPRLIVADEPVSMLDASLRATILSSLQALSSGPGISIVYITHDLITAYQICTNIVVMYAGSVVEAGSVERVIRSPQHPYTQLLVASIPLLDRGKQWTGLDLEGTRPAEQRQSKGCPFAPRCPAVMEICWNERPAMYTTAARHAAACFLYQDKPAVASADVSEVFVQGNGVISA
ncbi:MAG: ABC transporter ATP-binding protein [Anaerolineales bacterium]|nr:ABC transporter ATP-binding protein [Anaerolineales bacterium]